MLITLALTVIAYLFGSISTAIIVCRVMGLPDPRTQGSQNPGATNVLRYGGKKAAAITLVGDMLKGLIPVLLARLITSDISTLSLVAGGAFIGHMFPVFFGFKGGKGVATAFGVLLGLNWLVALSVLFIWLTLAVGLKISSLSAIIAALCLPGLAWYLDGRQSFLILSVCITLILVARHHQNIRNLIHGSEEKINKDKET